MDTAVLDMSYLYELSGNDTSYIHDVVTMFLESVPPGLAKLERSIREANDYEAIVRQSHFLKSSANIIRVRDMFEDLSQIETSARDKTGMDEITARLDNILSNFSAALPEIRSELKKTAN